MTEHSTSDTKKWNVLRLERGKLMSLLDSTQDGVYVINPNYDVEYVNSALQSGLGPVEGRKCYQYFRNREEPCVPCSNEAIFSGKTIRLEWYFPKIRRTYDLIITPVRNVNGKVSKLGIFHDITDRRRVEEELQIYRGRLEELVRKRTHELTEVNRKLEQEINTRQRMDRKLERLYNQEKELRRELEVQMKQRIEFLKALVHELKTPLTALLAASDLLVDGAKGEQRTALVKNIQLGALTLSRRIGELFDLVRGETGILQLKSGQIDLLHLLRSVADYVTPEAAKRQQTVTLELPSFLPTIQGDQDRIQQVLLNLLNNAFKFTPKGGRIILKAKRDDSSIIVEVQDTGHGIAPDKQERLFKPYHRQENDDEQFSGLGLGLALCKTLVSLHGGKIWVESQETVGSTFCFSLPLAKCRQKI